MHAQSKSKGNNEKLGVQASFWLLLIAPVDVDLFQPLFFVDYQQPGPKGFLWIQNVILQYEPK